MDQFTTGLRDSHGVLLRKPTEIMANHRLLFTPFELRRCGGHHQHSSVCNRELSMAAHYTPRCSPSLSMQFRSHTIFS
eukprot:862039-Pyramimonas_sp.AAC.1